MHCWKGKRLSLASQSTTRPTISRSYYHARSSAIVTFLRGPEVRWCTKKQKNLHRPHLQTENRVSAHADRNSHIFQSSSSEKEVSC